MNVCNAVLRVSPTNVNRSFSWVREPTQQPPPQEMAPAIPQSEPRPADPPGSRPRRPALPGLHQAQLFRPLAL
eukprot:1782293-Amphidinium_carterae.1